MTDLMLESFESELNDIVNHCNYPLPIWMEASKEEMKKHWLALKWIESAQKKINRQYR